MICSKSLQGRFVTGRFTPLIMLCASLCMWVAGWVFIGCQPANATVGGPDNLLSGLLALVCVVLSAIVIGTFSLFERRVRWLSALFLWLAALTFPASSSLSFSFSLLLLLSVISLLFHCQLSGMPEPLLFRVYLVAGTASLVSSQFLFLVPLLLVVQFAGSTFSIRKLLAALLGFAAPFWLLYGLFFVYPPLSLLTVPFISNPWEALNISFSIPSLYAMLQMLAELFVAIPFAVMFLSSSVPGKPLLRRRLAVILFFYIYMLLLPLLAGEYAMFQLLRLPCVAIMASYMFVFKVNRLFNIYFVFINLLWLAMVPLYIWLR